MSIILTFITCLIFVILGKLYLKKWINHITIYSFFWGTCLILYEFKLIQYVSLSTETWFVVTLTSILFFLGFLTVIFSRSVFSKPTNVFHEIPEFKSFLFFDNGKLLIKLILVISVLTILAALHYWYLLINKFGSIPLVFANANIVYRLRIEGGLEGSIPYVSTLAYSGVFLGGIVTAYRNKINIVSLLPFISIILSDMAAVGRAGIFIGFLEFIITIILFRHYLGKTGIKKIKKNKLGIIISVILITSIAIASSSAIRSYRRGFEVYKASTSALNKLQGGFIITPSVYLYFSSNVGVLNQYLYGKGEGSYFGENTFLPVYNFLSKLEIVKKPNFYPKGYYIPMWSNSATYLRDFHADFGSVGLFLLPFLLGLLTTYFWFKFYETGKIISLVILVYLFLIVAFSNFFMITRLAIWFFSFTFLIVLFLFLEKYLKNKFKSNPN